MTSDFAYRPYDLVSAPVFVLEISEDGEPVYAALNTFALNRTGRPLSDFIGHTAQEIYPQAYGRTAYKHHCTARDSGVAMTYQLDLPIGGVTRSIRTTLRPDFDAQGVLCRMIGTSVDLSAERQAQEAKVQFDTLTAEMEQFVALAAHDLRGPMRNVAAITDLLRDDFVDHGDCKTELLDTLEKIALKTMDLVADVLQHVETAAVDNAETVFSFPALCQDICDTLDPGKVHKITTSTATVSADRVAMQIALRNMIENAIKHSCRDSLKIDIEVTEGAPGMLEVALTDNGEGFSTDALKVMNNSQFRAESGYGLFAVKRLISARNGNLVAQNLPDGGGAMVRFSLPGIWINGAARNAQGKDDTRVTRNLYANDRRHSA